jgi:hypothetical protein
MCGTGVPPKIMRPVNVRAFSRRMTARGQKQSHSSRRSHHRRDARAQPGGQYPTAVALRAWRLRFAAGA